MAERKLLELAPGSRWNGDHCEIVDSFGGLCRVEHCDNGNTLVSADQDDQGLTAPFAQDIIALLHRAGLLDELLAKAWDEGRECGWDNAMDEAHYERPYPHKNPYRKAGENG